MKKNLIKLVCLFMSALALGSCSTNPADKVNPTSESVPEKQKPGEKEPTTDENESNSSESDSKPTESTDETPTESKESDPVEEKKDFKANLVLNANTSEIEVKLVELSNDFLTLSKFKYVLKESDKVIESNELDINSTSFKICGLQDETTYVVEIFAVSKDDVLVASESIKTLKADAEFEGLKFEDKEFVYDANKHEVVVENLPEGTKVTYKNNEAVDAGTYNASAVVSKDGFKTVTLNCKLVIKKANSKLTYDNTSFEKYYGDVVDYSSNVPFSAFVNDKEFKAVKNNDNYELKLELKYVGNVFVNIKSLGTNNFLGFDEKLNYELKLKDFSDLALESKSFDYDGCEHGTFVSNLPADATVSYTNNNQVDAGSYEVVAIVKQEGYNDYKLEAKLEIKKVSAKLIETELENEIYYNDSVTYKSQFEFKVNDIVATRINDEYVATITFKQEGINNYVIECASCNNYDGFKVERSYDVKLREFNGLSFKSFKTEYNGEEHSITVLNAPSDALCEYTNNKGVNAGVYEASVVVSKEGYKTVTLNATLEITKIPTEWNKENISKPEYCDNVTYYSQVDFEASIDDLVVKASKNDEDGLYYATIKLIKSGDVSINLKAVEKENYEAFNDVDVIRVSKSKFRNKACGYIDSKLDTKKQIQKGTPSNLYTKYNGEDHEFIIKAPYSFDIKLGNELVCNSKLENGSYVAIIKHKDVIYNQYTMVGTDPYVEDFTAKFNVKISGIDQKKVLKNLDDTIYYTADGYDLVLSQPVESGNQFVASAYNYEQTASLNADGTAYELTIHIKDAQIYTYKIQSKSGNGFNEYSDYITVEIVKKDAKVEYDTISDFVYDGNERTVKFTSNAKLLIEVNGTELANISTTDGQFEYTYSIVNVGKYDFVILGDDEGFKYPEMNDFSVNVTKSNERFTALLDNSDVLSLKADGNDHTLLVTAKLPFILFDSNLNEVESVFDDTNKLYQVNITLKEIGNYQYTCEFKNSTNFEYPSYDVICNLTKEAAPEFSFSLDDKEITSIDYDSNKHIVKISEKNLRSFVCKVTYNNNTTEMTSTEGICNVELLNAGEYTIEIVCDDYNDIFSYTVNKVVLPVNVYEVSLDQDNNEILTEYNGLGTKTNNFVVKSSYNFGIGEEFAELNTSSNLYELKVNVRKTTELNIVSLDDNHLDSSYKFIIVLPEIDVNTYIVSNSERVIYDLSSVDPQQFIFVSKTPFKIDTNEAVLNETSGLYELSLEIKESIKLEIVSLDEYVGNKSIDITITKPVITTATFDWTDAKHSLNDTYTSSDGSKVKVTITNAQKTTDITGICAGTSKKIGKIVMEFTDANGNAKTVKKINAVLSRWSDKQPSYCSVNGKTCKITTNDMDFEFDINSSTVTFESSNKDYRFFVKSILVEWE